MNPGDRLSVLTNEALPTGPVPVQLTLAVNEVSEAQHGWNGRSPYPPAVHQHTRLRIIRRGDFVPEVNAVPVGPDVLLEPGEQRPGGDRQHESGADPDLRAEPVVRMYGTLFSVRYSNSNNDGKLVVVESRSHAFYESHTNIRNAAWSRVAYAAHDDLIALSATTGVVGGDSIVDIELVRVEPGDRLRGRFSEAEAVGGNNL